MSQMIEVKTIELIGPALDWAVAKAIDQPVVTADGLTLTPDCARVLRYSTDWSQGGPLIDKHHVQTSYNGNGFSRSPTREYWCAYVCKPSGQEEMPSGGGPTALVAICRAIVAAKFGDVVSVPAELAQSKRGDE